MQRREPPEVDDLLEPPWPPDKLTQTDKLDNELHQLVALEEVPVFVVDPLAEGCPIIGVSCGLEALSQHSPHDLCGSSWQVLFSGVPDVLLARSAIQEFESFFRMARLKGINKMADCAAVVTICRADKTSLKTHCSLRLVNASHVLTNDCRSSHYVVAVLTQLDEALCTNIKHVIEEDSVNLDKLALLFGGGSEHKTSSLQFFATPLSFKCMLLNHNMCGMRREPHQVPRGCILMTSSCLTAMGGNAAFDIVIEQTLSHWASRLPVLGFTCTSPDKVKHDKCFFGTVPHAFCLGESIMIGGSGEGWMHLQPETMCPRMGQKIDSEVLHKQLSPDIPEHRRCAPILIRQGDVLGCRFQVRRGSTDQSDTRSSSSMRCSTISLSLNGTQAFQFEFDHILPQKPLYAVVDVCFSVYKVSLPGAQTDMLIGG